MINNQLAIVGASGHGKVLGELAELCGYVVHFFDDAKQKGDLIEHWSIIGTSEDLISAKHNYCGAAVGIGDNIVRAEKIKFLLSNQIECPVLIHPTSSVSAYSKVGKGSVILAGARVTPFSSIGVGTILNTNSVVEHDCQIGNFAHLSPSVSIAGGCFIADYSWIGIGSSVKQGLSISEFSVIGAGSVVVKNIPPNVIAYGNPAKVIKD